MCAGGEAKIEAAIYINLCKIQLGAISGNYSTDGGNAKKKALCARVLLNVNF